MIGLTFALTGMALFLIQVGLNDTLIAFRRVLADAESFAHDTQIFPDHEQN